jgi:hypothetical protein
LSRLTDLVAPARLGPNFRWLLASSWATNLGDGITLAAGPLLVASQTHNPLAVAMAALLQRLPWLMSGLYGCSRSPEIPGVAAAAAMLH